MYIFFLFLIVNHHLIESKEYKYKPSTGPTIFDILRESEYNFHSDVQTNSVSTQVNFINDIIKFEKSIQTDSIPISSTEVKQKN
jgi:hypothetical protein